ncbi:hypothetical protein [Rugosimonospora africana]|uniref:Uncharacterized protein n=1 Tax=Rugosimonospora africana TaxID=556532 RepID=A0A8J3QWP4_9ACTN|nr:hypothetical protein [Rugosimonospora africana]GIH17198.1 hypothetical protein Raf01_53700 [Rugosimonospora africana]
MPPGAQFPPGVPVPPRRSAAKPLIIAAVVVAVPADELNKGAQAIARTVVDWVTSASLRLP